MGKVGAIGLVKNTSSRCKEASFKNTFGFKDLIEYSHHRQMIEFDLSTFQHFEIEMGLKKSRLCKGFILG